MPGVQSAFHDPRKSTIKSLANSYSENTINSYEPLPKFYMLLVDYNGFQSKGLIGDVAVNDFVKMIPYCSENIKEGKESLVSQDTLHIASSRFDGKPSVTFELFSASSEKKRLMTLHKGGGNTYAPMVHQWVNLHICGWALPNDNYGQKSFQECKEIAESHNHKYLSMDNHRYCHTGDDYSTNICEDGNNVWEDRGE